MPFIVDEHPLHPSQQAHQPELRHADASGGQFAVGIQNIVNIFPAARLGQVRFGDFRTIRRLIAGQVAVIMVLVHHQNIPGGVDCHAKSRTGVINHPVIPGWSSDGEIRHLGIELVRKNEIVNAPWRIELAALRHIPPQPGFPIAAEIQRLNLVQVPALADQ